MFWDAFIAIHFFHSVHIVREQFSLLWVDFQEQTPYPFSSIPESHVTCPCFVEDVMKSVSTSSLYGILKTGHFTHSQLWTFQRPSEQIFLSTIRPLRVPRFSRTNAISIFLNTGEPCYVSLLCWRCHEKCIHLFTVRNFENWTFHPFPTLDFSEAFRTDFFYQQSDRCVPLGNNLGPISSKSESKKSKQLFINHLFI